jgi:type IV pilus assembly protein PilC
MAKYSYIARDVNGIKQTGFEDANSVDELIARLQSRNFIIISISEEGSFTGQEKGTLDRKSKRRLKRYRVTSGDLTIFCRQLATLLGAGVTILKSLDIISKQVASRKLFNILKSLQKSMEQGLSLHESMAKHKDVFSELWVNLIESGEAGGNLATVLSRLASYLERNEAFKRKIISAVMYPILLLVFGLGALLFLTIKIIPTFAELFVSFNVELPFLTRVLISVSVFLRKNVLIILGVFVIGGFLLRKYVRTKKGRIQLEEAQFKMPLFGDFFRALVVERFSSNMSTLLESGVPILYSLEITERSVGNLVMSDLIRHVKEEVRDGKSLSNPMGKSDFFEPMVVQMVNVGEEIGELPQMFKRIDLFYQEYIDTFLVRFTSLFEPLMLVFMGFVIGVMVIGMFLPIFQIAKISG